MDEGSVIVNLFLFVRSITIIVFAKDKSKKNPTFLGYGISNIAFRISNNLLQLQQILNLVIHLLLMTYSIWIEKHRGNRGVSGSCDVGQ